MKAEGHLRKAKAFEDRARLGKEAWEAPSVIEDILDATVHYIAYGILARYNTDIDAHRRQKRFLTSNDETRALNAFESIERFRISSVYGKGWNGERVEKAFELLEEVKDWSSTNGR